MTGAFFSKKFCHPGQGDKLETTLANCLKQTDATACTTESCVWSTAKELIPPHDFCAPAEMTQDFATVNDCTNIEIESNCLKTCSWYKGSGDFSNSTQPGTNGTTTMNICMPTDLTNTDDMTACVLNMNKADCKDPQCKWMNTADLAIPTSVCMPNDMSDQTLMSTCTKVRSESTCAAPCTWIDPSMLASMSDPNAEVCRPQLTSATKIDSIMKCS